MSRTIRLTSLALAALLVAAGFVAPASAQQVKVAVIDVERILLESNVGQAALEEIEALRNQKAEQLDTMRQELQAIQTRISDGALSLSEGTMADLRKEGEDKMLSMQRFQEDAQRELNKKREQVLGDIEKKVFPVINEVGEAGGYTLIFNKYNSGLVYASEAVDITEEVITRFNAANPAPAAQ